MKRITFLLITTFMILSLSPACVADDAIGWFTYVEGRVDLLRGESDRALPIIHGEEVFQEDIIRTKSFSRAEITFLDGSSLRLAPRTRVLVDCYHCDGKKREKASLKLYRGKVRAIVSKQRGKANFFVSTPNTSGAIKGSDIMIFYQGNMTTVMAKEGGISIFNPMYPKDAVTVRRGEALSVPADGPPLDKRDYIDVEMKLHYKDTDPRERVIAGLKDRDLDEMEGWVANRAGSVEIKKSGRRDWRGALMNDSLKEGDELKTGEEGDVEIRLDNGNSVVLKPNTEVKLTKLKRDPKTGEYENLFEARQGKLKAVIDKLEGKSTFKVKTPVALCGVRGTVMYLDIEASITKAFYEGGGGDITNLLSGKTKIVGSGYNAYADINGFVSDPQFTTNDERMNLDEAWGSSRGVEGYSSPKNNTRGFSAQGPVGKTTKHTTKRVASGVGSLFINLPPEPKKTQPPPPTGDLTFEGRFSRFNEDTGSFEYIGSLNAGIDVIDGEEIDPPDIAQLTVTGSYNNPSESRLWTGTLIGSPAEQVNLRGWIVGATGSWGGICTALYIGEDGQIGGCFGLLHGEGHDLNGGGDIFVFPIEDDTPYKPADLYNDDVAPIATIDGFLSGEERGAFIQQHQKIAGRPLATIGKSLEGEARNALIQQHQKIANGLQGVGDGEDEGIWRGFYKQDYVPANQVVGPYYVSKLNGVYDEVGTLELYLLGKQLNNDTSLLYVTGASYPGQPMTYLGAALGTTIIDEEGYIDFDIGAAGITNEFDFNLAGVSVPYNSLYAWDDAEEEWAQIGNSIYLAKLASKFPKSGRWAGYSSYFESIGELILSGPIDGPFVWLNNDEEGYYFSSYDPYRDSNTTLDGVSYYGGAGGGAEDNWIFGGARALYIAPSDTGTPQEPEYNAGLMFIKGLNGFYSDDSNMSSLNGIVETMQMVEDIGIDPELLHAGEGGAVIEEPAWDENSGDLVCNLPGGGSLMGSLNDQMNMSINGQDWGVWDSDYNFSYVNNGFDSWTALGSADVISGGYTGKLYNTIVGYHYTDGAMELEMIGVSLVNGMRTFYTGVAKGIYGSPFHGVGTGVFFQETVFGDFITPYSETVFDRNILFAMQSPVPGEWVWNGQFMTEGGAEGAIGARWVYGGGLAFSDRSGDFIGSGLSYLKIYGAYAKPLNPVTGWRLPIGGLGWREASAQTPASVAWIGTLNGETWESGKVWGTYEGLYFSQKDDDGKITTTMGVVGGDGSQGELNGKVIGNYLDGEDYTWEGLCVAEWVEVTDLLDPSIFNDFSSFMVNVPITEAYSDILQGGAGNFNIPNGGALYNVAFDFTFYENANSEIFWTGLVDGQFNGNTDNNWTVGMMDSPDQVDIVGDLWDIATNEWHATVTGEINGYTFENGSELAGTFETEGGTFSGGGGGQGGMVE
jgi:hypothetical protein